MPQFVQQDFHIRRRSCPDVRISETEISASCVLCLCDNSSVRGTCKFSKSKICRKKNQNKSKRILQWNDQLWNRQTVKCCNSPPPQKTLLNPKSTFPFLVVFVSFSEPFFLLKTQDKHIWKKYALRNCFSIPKSRKRNTHSVGAFGCKPNSVATLMIMDLALWKASDSLLGYTTSQFSKGKERSICVAEKTTKISEYFFEMWKSSWICNRAFLTFFRGCFINGITSTEHRLKRCVLLAGVWLCEFQNLPRYRARGSRQMRTPKPSPV